MFIVVAGLLVILVIAVSFIGYGVTPKEGDLRLIKVCGFCDKRLTESQAYYNDGMCPHCGRIGGATICHYVKVVLVYKDGKWVRR